MCAWESESGAPSRPTPSLPPPPPPPCKQELVTVGWAGAVRRGGAATSFNFEYEAWLKRSSGLFLRGKKDVVFLFVDVNVCWVFLVMKQGVRVVTEPSRGGCVGQAQDGGRMSRFLRLMWWWWFVLRVSYCPEFGVVKSNTGKIYYSMPLSDCNKVVVI